MSHTRNAGSREAPRMSRAAWALIRVWTGVVFCMVGLVQLPDLPTAGLVSGFASDVGLGGLTPAAPGAAVFVAGLEVVVGLLLVLGGFTPYAALLGLGITLWTILPGGLDITSAGATFAILLFAIILSRAGRIYGMDALLHRRMPLPLM